MKRNIALFFLLLAIFLPYEVFASVPSQIQINGINDFWQIIVKFLNFLWPIFVGAAIIMFFVAGFLFLTAGNDPGKVKIARSALIWGIIGMIIGIMAVSIPNIIGNVLGL